MAKLDRPINFESSGENLYPDVPQQPFNIPSQSVGLTPNKIEPHEFLEILNLARNTFTPDELATMQYVDADEVSSRVGVTTISVVSKLRTFRKVKMGNKWFWERTSELENFINAWMVMRENQSGE